MDQFVGMPGFAVTRQILRAGDHHHAAGTDPAHDVARLQAFGDTDGEVDAFLQQIAPPVAVIDIQIDFRIARGEVE